MKISFSSSGCLIGSLQQGNELLCFAVASCHVGLMYMCIPANIIKEGKCTTLPHYMYILIWIYKYESCVHV